MQEFYVSRKEGAITAAFLNPQHDTEPHPVSETDPDYLAFLAKLHPPGPVSDLPRRMEQAEEVLAYLVEPVAAEEAAPAEAPAPVPSIEDELARLREQNEALASELARVSEALSAATAPPATVEDEAPADGIPNEFRGLMLDGESPERFTERMRRRWQALKHLQIDGTKPTPARALPDMTPEESEELADLERRNSQHKWLD